MLVLSPRKDAVLKSAARYARYVEGTLSQLLGFGSSSSPLKLLVVSFRLILPGFILIYCLETFLSGFTL